MKSHIVLENMHAVQSENPVIFWW